MPLLGQGERKMSIKFRLVLSYVAMVFIPIILSVIAAIIIFISFLGVLGQKTWRNESIIDIPEKVLNLCEEIDTGAEKNPDSLLDLGYLDKVGKQFEYVNVSFVVRKGDRILYSNKVKNHNGLIELLPEFKSINDDDFGTVKLSDKSLQFKQYDFMFSDGTKGSTFLIADLSFIARITVNYFKILGWTALFIFILTNGVITYLVSRSILKPLKLLRHGTEQIKQGNLDFEVKTKSKDEIGDLCVAFEEMRVKLKKSIELQLQYEENRKELISSISHDLKTPITAIKGYVEGIMDGVANSPEKVNKYVKTIYAKSVDMDKLIDDLFLFSKLDLKKLPFNFERVDIKEYFQDCIDEIQVDLQQKNIELSFDSTGVSSTLVIADREKLKRIVTNIIQNAIKYMDKEKGIINIRLKEEAESIVVQIEDNGQGISEDDIPFIFERFYRADPSRNLSTGGSGLGLAIAKQIIEGHKGRIWAESKLDIGTSMFFTLKKA